MIKRNNNTLEFNKTSYNILHRYKPAVASSENGEGKAANAVDGVPTIVHEGRKCSETKSEKSPWWTVDLLSVQVIFTFHFYELELEITKEKNLIVG